MFSYYLVDDQGEGVVGPLGIDRFLPTSGVTGWNDDDSLLYVADLDIPQIAKWDLATGDHSVVRPVPVEDAFDLVTVTPGRRRAASGGGSLRRGLADQHQPTRAGSASLTGMPLHTGRIAARVTRTHGESWGQLAQGSGLTALAYWRGAGVPTGAGWPLSSTGAGWPLSSTGASPKAWR